MCDSPQKSPQNTANSPQATKPAVQVGDEYEIRVRIVETEPGNAKYAYKVQPVGQAFTNWFDCGALAAGRLVATRPLAVGDEVEVGPHSPWPARIVAIVGDQAWYQFDDKTGRAVPLSSLKRWTR